MRKQGISRITAVAAALFVCGGALAHSGASGIVKKRMEAMSDVGKQMKSIARMAKGEVAFNAGSVTTSARTIAGHAEMIPDLFPKGSTRKPSEALPQIWTDWGEFTKLATDLQVSAHGLASTAENATDAGDIMNDLVAVGGTCRGCHERFRATK